MIWTLYQLFIQKLWRAIANADPIGIMKLNLKKWTGKRAELEVRSTELKAVKAEIERALNDNQKTAQADFRAGKEYQGQGNDERARYKGIALKRTMMSSERLQNRLQAVTAVTQFLDKLHERWGYELERLGDDISIMERDMKILSKTSDALKLAQSIIKGDPNDAMMQDMANQAYAEQVSSHVAYITNFMDRSKGWMQDSDVMEKVLGDDGENLLNSYNEDEFLKLTDFKQKADDAMAIKVGSNNQMEETAKKTFDQFKELK